jgi:hypothetical protein
MWCHRSDCPNLERKISYDVLEETGETDEEGELEYLIRTGVSEEETKKDDVKGSIKRVGSPTKKNHDLGVLASFSSKSKAIGFIETYFKLNQDSSPDDLQITEITITS